MRKDIHPDYHPVVYVDVGADFEFVSRSTMTSDETRTIDGVDHYVIKLEISSASHPFYTGKQHFVDTAGRIEKFRQRFGERGSKKNASDEQAEQTENG
jgi:large subunit ribosomal protein L31